LIVLFTSVAFAISYGIDSSNIIFNFKPVKFIILVIISLLLFPFQIGYEEYLFRGYLMQQIGIIAKNKWFPLIVTSIAFGLMHSANPEVAELGYGTMVFYIGTGLLLGIMTLMDDGLELALGFHFGNNFISAILVSVDFAALQTDALFKDTNVVDKTGILGEMILSIMLIYPIILLIFSKKYKWTNWKEKLFGKVEAPSVTVDPHQHDSIVS
jgi:membrane protease YdiL (CAAX protease family)